MTTRKQSPLDRPADHAFRERNADFAAAWAERLKRDTPAPAPSVLHRHTDACWLDQDARPVPRETHYEHGTYVEGRTCQTKHIFVAERVVGNPNAVKR